MKPAKKIFIILIAVSAGILLTVLMSFSPPEGNRDYRSSTYAEEESGSFDVEPKGPPVPGSDSDSSSQEQDQELDDSGKKNTDPEFNATEIIFLNAQGTGDYPALNEAVADAAPGAMILLAQGTYYLDSPLQIENSIALVGEGMENTLIISDAGEEVIWYNGSGKFFMDSVSVEYAGTEESDILYITGGKVFISNSRFAGGETADQVNWGTGAFFLGSSSGTIINCLFEDNDFCGIDIEEEAECFISNSIFRDNGVMGINYYGETGGGVASGNELFGNGSDGIQVQLNSHPVLIGNYCHDNTGGGIAFFDGSGGFALNNRIENNDENGISASNQSTPVIISNTVKGHKGFAGIGFWENSAGSAMGNICSANGWGIYVESSTGPYLEANSCSGNDINLLDER
jgi:parallel beta-helix repeat protein